MKKAIESAVTDLAAGKPENGSLDQLAELILTDKAKELNPRFTWYLGTYKDRVMAKVLLYEELSHALKYSGPCSKTVERLISDTQWVETARCAHHGNVRMCSCHTIIHDVKNISMGMHGQRSRINRRVVDDESRDLSETAVISMCSDIIGQLKCHTPRYSDGAGDVVNHYIFFIRKIYNALSLAVGPIAIMSKCVSPEKVENALRSTMLEIVLPILESYGYGMIGENYGKNLLSALSDLKIQESLKRTEETVENFKFLDLVKDQVPMFSEFHELFKTQGEIR